MFSIETITIGSRVAMTDAAAESLFGADESSPVAQRMLGICCNDVDAAATGYDGKAMTSFFADIWLPEQWKPVWDRFDRGYNGYVFARMQAGHGSGHRRLTPVCRRRDGDLWPDPLKVLPPYATTEFPTVHCQLR